ncbi:MAG: 2-hydroxyacid dehydrogenase [Oscillospiraceae bacterium]|nr:2-hydroxyacid dehydrogenase [Oscillospiraceae bacterium]
MKTILFTNKYKGLPLEIVQSEVPDGFEIEFLTEQTQDALLRQAAEADYILAGGRLKITEEVLEKAGRLRMIQRSGVGLDALDLEAMRKKGIPLYVNQGVNAESVAEHALLLMLACLRNLPVINRRTKEGIWEKQEQGVRTTELKGKTVGIVGMGNIARTLVGLLKPFRVQILYYDIMRQSAEFEDGNNMRFAGIDELIESSDIITIHCALTDDTRDLINNDRIRTMKTGVVLINTARGEIVDTDAVAEALKSGKISYAAFDVHESEPIPDDYPLKSIDNVILTPHIAGVTADSFRAMMRDAFRNIDCFEQGRLEEIAPYRYL